VTWRGLGMPSRDTAVVVDVASLHCLGGVPLLPCFGVALTCYA